MYYIATDGMHVCVCVCGWVGGGRVCLLVTQWVRALYLGLYSALSTFIQKEDGPIEGARVVVVLNEFHQMNLWIHSYTLVVPNMHE